MVIPSTNSFLGQFHESNNVYPFGQNIKSSSNSSAHPLFGTSSPFAPPMAASAFAEKISSPFGSTSSHFAGSTFSIQNQGNALRQSNSHFGPTVSLPPNQTSCGSIDGLAFGTPTAGLMPDSSVKRPFGTNDTWKRSVLPSFGLGGSIGDISVDRAPRNSDTGASNMTILGAPNNSGIGFKSTPKVLHSNRAYGSTSSIFGVSNEPPFAPGSSSSGFSTTIFGFPSTSASQFTTPPGFGIKSRPSFWSASASAASNLSGPKSSPFIGVPNISNFSDSPTSRFRLGSTSAPGNSSIFKIPSSSRSMCTKNLGSTVTKERQGSGVASYSATREVNGANSMYSVGKIQSISAMPIYKDKSHEELRLEDYGLCNKDGRKPWTGQSSASACFKIFDTPTNIFCCSPLPNYSSVNPRFHPFKFDSSASKSQASIMPDNANSMSPTFSSSTFPSQSQAFMPQPTVVSSKPIFPSNVNPSSLIPFTESMVANSCRFPTISTTFTGPSFSTFSSSMPSSMVFASVQSSSVTALGSEPCIPNASQPEQIAQKVDSLSTNSLSQPSEGTNGLTMVTEVGSQSINGQQYVSLSTVGMQTSLVANPFATPSIIDRPNVVISVQYGISSLPVSNKLSPGKRASSLRIRHLSLRHNRSLPVQRHICGSNKPKVPFFCDKDDRPCPTTTLLPRQNARAWVMNSLPGQEQEPLRPHADGKGCDDKARPNSSFQLNVNSTAVTDNPSIQPESLSAITNSHQDDDDAAVTEEHDADILSLMPKLPDGEYYTEPPLKELEVKERTEPGYCSHVNDFVVGRRGYGSIKFLGETNVRCLNLESIVQFKNREVIVYADDRKRPPVGQSLNKPAEIILLNIKCLSKMTGKQYVDGPQVHRFKEMLIKKTAEQGAEFVAYDPVLGEWKFRVKHF